MYYSYSLLVLLSHFTGLNESFGGRIYCSQVTCDLLLLRFPALSSRVSALELDVPHVLYSDVDGTSFTVTLYDANHCPGSAMFLFHGDFGTVLYTGDFRYDEVEMKAAFGSLVGQIDRVVIDATFGRPSMRFPSKSQSCNMLVDLIQTLLPSARRVLLPFKLGDEELVVQLCRRLKTKICLDQSHPAALERSQQWSLLESVRPYLTDDSTITKLRVAQPRGQIVCQPGDVVVKASTQWFLQNVQNAIASSNDVLLKPVKDEFNQYHVFYSMHSDLFEIKELLTYLQPSQISWLATPSGSHSLEADVAPKSGEQSAQWMRIFREHYAPLQHARSSSATDSIGSQKRKSAELFESHISTSTQSVNVSIAAATSSVVTLKSQPLQTRLSASASSIDVQFNSQSNVLAQSSSVSAKRFCVLHSAVIERRPR